MVYVERQMTKYNSAKDVPHFCKWGLGLITGGRHIFAGGKMPTEEVLPAAKLERRRYNMIQFLEGVQGGSSLRGLGGCIVILYQYDW